MRKTNEQEREALWKIEDILEDFDPEETYIGKAFESCVELARANIVNGGMESWKDHYLEEQLKNCRLSGKVEALTKTLNQKDDAIARLEDAKNQLSKELEEVKAAQETADDLRQTILELKAKLYDMMTGEEVSG